VEDAPDDELLVHRAQADRRAFALLYARYADPVFRYCARRLDTPEAAADATSQVFLQALRALPSYRHGSFRAWLFTIAAHVVADSTRRQLRPRSLDAAPEVAAAIPDPGPSLEEISFAHESESTVSALLRRLPPQQRHVVELRLAGLTGPEIATVLGMTVAGVRSTQYRAYTRLRTLLQAEALLNGGTS
jgi:RNA polymerase sigma-70 factor (ECF subfamily)